MTEFTTRVELHGATDNDYANLHKKMEEKGFQRTIQGTDAQGVTATYAMPTAEYNYNSYTMTCAQVRELAKQVADGVRSGAWVLVTQVASRSWTTKKVMAAKAA